jgi:hypothetical protein
VKVSEVIAGVKKVFNNVFVRALEELVAPGMNTFYQKLHNKGVRFHYVVRLSPLFITKSDGSQSNSPFGLLPILMEFLQVSELPQGVLTCCHSVSVQICSFSFQGPLNFVFMVGEVSLAGCGNPQVNGNEEGW